MKRAFTLIELMIVVAIMGLMGTLSVGGYRAMRRGMEERGVVQNVNQFVRNAYQRASIDRQPTAVYFWNETRRLESDDETLLVVGHAVAVRQAGRVSYVNENLLLDEFSDLKFYRATNSEGEDDDQSESDEASDGLAMYIYRIKGNEVKRCSVGQTTMKGKAQDFTMLASDPMWVKNHEKIAETAGRCYGYLLRSGNGDDNIDWKAGDAYSFEFADLTLPNNYIFGGNSDYQKTSLNNPVKVVSTKLIFRPGEKPSNSVQISSLMPDSSGALSAQSIGDTSKACDNLSEQNK